MSFDSSVYRRVIMLTCPTLLINDGFVTNIDFCEVYRDQSIIKFYAAIYLMHF